MSGETLAKSQKRRKEIPGLDPADDKFLSMVVALTGELVIARERIDTLERLIEEAGIIKRSDIESFEAKDEPALERQAIRKRIIAKAMRPITVGAEKDLLAALAIQSAVTSPEEV